VIEFAHSAAGINPEQLRGFFADRPDPPSPERQLALLRGSDHVVVARDGERVVGFATAIRDGVLSACIREALRR
jgi:hypothetical protein